MNRLETGSAPDRDKWADVVSSAEDHVRMDASYVSRTAQPLPGRNVFVLLVGVVVAVAAALATSRIGPGSTLVLPPTQQASDLRGEVALLVEQIEAFREERGTLPTADLLEPFLDEGYEYEVLDASAGRYEVRRSAGGVEVTYDGSLPLGLWLTIGGATTGEVR